MNPRLTEAHNDEIQTDEVPRPTATISRRNLLLAGFGAAGLSLISDDASADASGNEQLQPNESPATANPESKETAHELSPLLDYTTAGVVLGSFVHRVLIDSAMRGIDLNWKSALQLNVAAQARIGALKYFGGEAGKHLADEDQHEIVEGLKPVAILVGLSDATTTALKVDEKAIFSAVENGTLAENFADIRRPTLGAGKEVWDSYLEEINNKIRTKAAQIAAITAVLAPIGTTYTSSSLANSMKKEMLRMLYEQSYAMEVSAQLRKMNITADNEALLDPDFDDKVHQKASARSNELFNGSKGFSKLMLTLGANTQGTWGIGDPPEIYFFKNHGSNGKRIAKAHAIGAANSQIFTVLTNLWWLRKAGIPVGGMFAEFIKSELTTVKSLLEILSDSKVRSVSFNDGRKFISDIANTLSKDDPAAATQLRDILGNIPDAKLQFSMRSYLKSKAQALSAMSDKLSKKTPAEIDENILADVDTFVDNYPFLDDLRKGLTDTDPAKQKSARAKMGETLQQAKGKIHGMKAARIASLLESISESDATTPDNHEETTETSTADLNNENQADFDAERVRTIHGNIRNLLTNFHAAGNPEAAQKAVQTLLDVKGERKTKEYHENLQTAAKVIYEQLASTDKSVVADAVQKLTTIEEGEKDAIEGLENVATPGQDIASVQHETHAAHGATFLSHSAKEVLWALLTQIPAVPSAARIAAKVIPIVAGVKEGQAPTVNQLQMIIALTLTLEAMLSATADNVAAYLFGEKVLSDFFKSTFGNDLFEKNPAALDDISIAALKVAENAGNLTKVGNGPNFSQEEFTVVKDNSNAQGIAIDVSSMKMGETLPHRNHIASAVNVMSVTMFAARLAQLAETLDLDKKIGK